MKHHLGFLLQLAVLTFLPVLIIGQLTFQFHLLVMPISLAISAVIFLIGYRLRES